MSELFGEAVSRMCASDRDRAIFRLAYGASVLLFKLADERALWDDASFKRGVAKLEKIKRMTSDTYDEIARVTNAAWEEQDDERADRVFVEQTEKAAKSHAEKITHIHDCPCGIP